MKEKIKITKSCNEDWNKMEIVGNCRFCSICEKNVMDFTTSSKYDILKKLKDNKNICGRINLYQIKEINSRKLRTRISPRWVIALGLGTFLGISEPVRAQTQKEKIELKEKRTDTITNEKSTNKIVRKGIVVDQDDLPLPGVHISLKGTEINTQSDFDGNFLFEIPKDSITSESRILFQYFSFTTQEIELSKIASFSRITMTADAKYYNEVVVTGKLCTHRSNIFTRISGFFSKLFGGKTCH